MSMDLQTAIQEAIALANSPNGMIVSVVVTMHDEDGQVLYGYSAPGFFSGTGGIFRVISQGFTTVGNPPPYANQNQFLASNKRNVAGTQPFDANQPIPLEFTVTRRTFAFVGFGLSSSIQLNVATLNAAGQASSRAVLYATQNGALLRGIGASLMSPGKQASYTVTLDVVPVIP